MKLRKPLNLSLLLFAAASLYLLTAVSIGVADAVFILRHHSRFPFGDHWIWLGRYYEHGLVAALLSQYNEHRLAVPGILFFLDQRFFGGTNTFLASCVVAVNIVVIALVNFALLRDRKVPLGARMIVLGASVILVFWFAQGGTFFFPFMIALAMANMWILASLWFFEKSLSSGTSFYLTGAILCGFAASFSYGHGILIWILLLINAVLLRVSWQRVAILMVAFGAASFLYFRHYYNPLHHGPFAGLSDPWKLIRYVVLMIGLPLFGVEKTDVTFASHVPEYSFAVLAILIASVALIAFFRRRSSQGLISHSVLMLGMGAAILAGLNRTNFPLSQALSGRYLPLPVLFWISLVAIVVATLSRLGSRSRLLLVGVCVALIVGTFATRPSHHMFAYYLSDRTRLQEGAALSIAIDAPDHRAISMELTDPELVEVVDRAYARSTGRPSMFYLPDSHLLGTNVRSSFQIAPPGTCLGGLDNITRLPNPDRGARLFGWAFDAHRGRPPRDMLITDRNGVVLGLGLVNGSRPDVAAAYHNSAMSDTAWIAYTRLPENGERQLGLFGKFGDKTLCDLTSRFSVLPK